jgi:hypothetical protein
MRPYGARGGSCEHIKSGGAPDGWMSTFKSYCRCCNGKYLKIGGKRSHHKKMKSHERKNTKKVIEEQKYE